MATSTTSRTICRRIMAIKNKSIPACGYIMVPSRTAFWSRKKKVDPPAEQRKLTPADGPTTLDRFQSLKKRTSVQTVKGYSPPDNVESKIQEITEQVCGQVPDWKKLALDDRYLKFKLLTKLIKEFDHDIPNAELNDMKTVSNVVRYYSTEVKDACSYEDMSRLDLPKNLHINVEPIRFDPENDPLFGGKTAFPGRPTIVSSIKYRRKFKGAKNSLEE
ncbi:hypothetical protein ScPMuIL_006146 [Solemya velum]